MSIRDKNTDRYFLIDSGADVSVFPVATTTLPVTGTLLAANGSKINTFGTKTLTLDFSAFEVEHSFLLADVPRPILGSDFFASHAFLIDVKNCQLVRLSGGTLSSAIPAVPDASHRAVSGLECKSPDPVGDLLAEFPEVLESSFDAAMPAHGVRHVVPTDGPPVFARSRRLDGEKLAVAKAEFQKMLSMKIIRPSSSPC